MLNNERQQQILSCMESKNTITVKELTDQLYASPSTIRRDLSELEAQGFLTRIHGGAVLTAGSTFDTPASLRCTQQLAEKQRIADLASRFLAPSATYFFDSSSTAAILATKLTMYPDVKVATNGVAILANMKSTEHLSILSTGGFLRSPWDELTGNLALKAIENLNADIFFFLVPVLPQNRALQNSATKMFQLSARFISTQSSAFFFATVRRLISSFSSALFPFRKLTILSQTAVRMIRTMLPFSEIS